MYQVVTEINNGNPLKMIYPESGSPYSLDGVSIVKGKDDKQNVKDVFTYLVNDYLVYDKDHYNPGKILEGQESQMKNYPEDIKYADMTGIDDLELRDEIAWQKEILKHIKSFTGCLRVLYTMV